MKSELQLAHRLVMISLHPGIKSTKPELQSLKSHAQIGCSAWDFLSVETLDVLCHGTFQGFLSLDVGQNPIR